MKKEYLRPEAFIVPMTTLGMMATSVIVDENEREDDAPVKEENITTGGSIWDNEW